VARASSVAHQHARRIALTERPTVQRTLVAWPALALLPSHDLRRDRQRWLLRVCDRVGRDPIEAPRA
jgi:hypothetical protein